MIEVVPDIFRFDVEKATVQERNPTEFTVPVMVPVCPSVVFATVPETEPIDEIETSIVPDWPSALVVQGPVQEPANLLVVEEPPPPQPGNNRISANKGSSRFI